MRLDYIHPALHFIAHCRAVGAALAGGRERVPFHIKHGRKAATGARGGADEERGLHFGGRAEIIKVVGAAFDSGLARTPPMVVEFDVFEVAPFGRFQEGELDADRFGPGPVDAGLEAGGIHAAHRISAWLTAGKSHRVGVANYHRSVEWGRAGGAGGKKKEQDGEDAESHGYPL